jgi:hypothetical protein
VRLWIGDNFTETGCFDYETYQKEISNFLYLPYYTCHPKHTLRGFIRGEFRRYLLRSSQLPSYVSSLCAFYDRLAARGYPASFLGPLFDAAPDYGSRSTLMTKAGQLAKSIPFCFKLTYSPMMEELQLGSVLRDNDGVLPAHLTGTPRIITWKRAPRLGALLKTSTLQNTDTAPPQPSGAVDE